MSRGWVSALICLVAIPLTARAEGPIDQLRQQYRDAPGLKERAEVVEALALYSSAEGIVEFLAEILTSEPEEALRLEVVKRLLEIKTLPSAQVLIRAVTEWDPFVAEAARAGLCQAPPPEAASWALERLTRGTDVDPRPIAALIDLIAAAERPRELERPLKRAWTEWSKANSALVRGAAARAVPQLDPKRAVPKLKRMRDGPLLVRLGVVDGLGQVIDAKQDDDALDVLRKLARRDDAWQVRLRAISVLAQRGAAERELLQERLEDRREDWRVRLEAVDALAKVRDKALVASLVAAREGTRGTLGNAIQRQLYRLTAQTWRTDDEWKKWWRAAAKGYEVPPEFPVDPDLDGTRTRVSFFGFRVRSERVCFVIDLSTSMGVPFDDEPGSPNRYVVARRELRKALESLPEEARFAVLVFHEKVLPIQPVALKASPKNVKAVLARVDALEPVKIQEADLYAPLVTALNGWRPNDPQAADNVNFDTLYLLSGGRNRAAIVRDPEAFRGRIRELNRYPRVALNVIAVGPSEEDVALLKGLAEDSGGSYEQR